MYCSNCGNKIEEGAKFCPFCGASQNESEIKTTQINTSSVIGEVKNNIENGKKSGNLYKILGWVSTVISLFFFPIIFGAVTIIMGYLYRDYEEKHGNILIIAGVAFALTGFFLGYGTPVYY
ncbi:MAG: zinc-ribbon domain-containing protein [Tetragenococcus koreensis]|uniref:zinc-ribbon domain-containing protein n=1 Tax=Tetragenococcus halophilus TaxID=51669 RepID=UPI0026511FA8|nr:zinc-ribbon domain-containing protein [Tetragenococcus koreensis]